MWQDSALVSADIFTQHHRFSGLVSTRGKRLQDFLNDPTTEMLEMRGVRVTQPTNSHSDPVECSQLLLKKDAIILAIPTGSYEAPARRVYSYVEKEIYQAQVTVPGYGMVGLLHLPARANHWLLMSEGGTTPSFVAITDVTVRFAARDLEPLHTKVVIFCRHYIESLHLAERPMNPQLVDKVAENLRSITPEDLLDQLNDEHPSAEPDSRATVPLFEFAEAADNPQRA